MKHKFVFLLLPLIISCSSTRNTVTYSKYNTYTLIHLDTIKESNEAYIEYENSVAIILIKIKDFVDFADNNIESGSLCKVKIEALKNMKNIICQGKEFYVMKKNISPNEYKRYSLPNYEKYRKNYIEPYGFSVITDTINKEKIAMEEWMISNICIKGNCLVLDKRTNYFSDKIYYIITDFKDGHGGENLHFKDKMIFHKVAVYSDIAWPDFDCMTDEEIYLFFERVKKPALNK